MITFRRLATLLIILLTVVLVRPGQAQLFDTGVKAGVNFSSFANADNTDFLTGFHVGAFLNISPPLSPVGIQPEILYTRLGSFTEWEQELIPGIPSTYEETLTIDYVQIPVIVKYYLPLPGPINPNLYLGPYMGFLVDANFKSDQDNGENDDPAEWVRDTDYGIVFGIGTEVNVMLSKIHLEARFTYGLQDVFEDEFANDEQHRAISISAGLAF